MLSALQLRVAAIVKALPEAEDFVLAGGGALVARGDVERTTRDLDYFARSADQVPRLHAALAEALVAAGLTATTVRASEGFVRMVVEDGSDTTEIDLAHDYRLLAPEESAVGRTLAAEELAIDKVLALFDRAEARTSSTSLQSSTGGDCPTSVAGRRRRTPGSAPSCSQISSTVSIDCRRRTSTSPTKRALGFVAP